MGRIDGTAEGDTVGCTKGDADDCSEGCEVRFCKGAGAWLTTSILLGF